MRLPASQRKELSALHKNGPLKWTISKIHGLIREKVSQAPSADASEPPRRPAIEINIFRLSVAQGNEPHLSLRFTWEALGLTRITPRRVKRGCGAIRTHPSFNAVKSLVFVVDCNSIETRTDKLATFVRNVHRRSAIRRTLRLSGFYVSLDRAGGIAPISLLTINVYGHGIC